MRLYLLALVLLFTNQLEAQVFLETFDEANTSVTGADNIGGVTWSATCPSCIPPSDYWHVNNGQFECQDTNGPAVWETTSDIDISGCSMVEITMDIEEDDVLEGCGTGCNAVDWVQLEYNVDNTGWQTPSNSTFCAGTCAGINVIQADDIPGGAMSYSSTCDIVAGTTLRLRVTVQTWAGTERWRIDNVTVNCASASLDAGPDQQVCEGSSVTLTASNTMGASISWNNGITDGVPFTPPVGSTYYTVTASMGACSVQDSALITTSPGPNFTLSSTNSSTCQPPFDGTITLSNLTPGATYDLTYDDGTGQVGPTTYTANGSGEIVLTNLAPDSYTNFLLDSAGCTTLDTSTIQITQPITPTVDAGPNQSVCEGDSITLTASNPNGGTLTWDNGVTDGVPFIQAPGIVTYHVTTDVSGCTATDSVDVTVTAIPTANVPPHGPYTISSGVQTISGSPAGGTWNASCGACINTTTGDFDPAVAGPGQHTVCYTAGTSPCLDSMCIYITVTTGCGMIGSINSNPPTCYQFSDGSVTVNVQFATGNVTFVIEDSLGNQVNSGNSNTANNLSEGWYYVTATDELMCVYQDSVFLDDPDEMQVDLDLFPPSCYGIQNGMAIADTVYNFTGNYGQISYVWAPNSGSNGIGEDTLFNAGGTGYTLLLTDENGCAITMDFNLPYPDSLYLVDFGSEPAYCRQFGYQSGNGVVYAAAAGGTPDYTYIWVNVDNGDTTNNTTWGGLNPANYEITVIDNNGCILKDTIYLDSLNPVAAFTMTSADFTAQYEGTAPVDVHFVNNSMYFANPNNPQADTTFFWNFGFGSWLISHDYYEEFDTTYLTGGVYEVCLVAINKNGCSDTACVPITIYDQQSFVPVNVFTPNEDGANDLFTFSEWAIAIDDFECVIVNRWGETVAIINDINDGWDGTNLKGKKCVAGVYFYKYVATAQNGEVLEGQGNVHLIRK
ncbi:MAG: gliding motility-associated C-terminal domain-containing protein [Crocinitomicaceae bacterium]|nr:gliding motility-associated C-terminal domain-containing protein [Crocinitomicaceae bacterium]